MKFKFTAILLCVLTTFVPSIYSQIDFESCILQFSVAIQDGSELIEGLSNNNEPPGWPKIKKDLVEILSWILQDILDNPEINIEECIPVFGEKINELVVLVNEAIVAVTSEDDVLAAFGKVSEIMEIVNEVQHVLE